MLLLTVLSATCAALRPEMPMLRMLDMERAFLGSVTSLMAQVSIRASKTFACGVVIPAKAGTRGEHMDVLGLEERGIHLRLLPKSKMDSRFRGNDGLVGFPTLRYFTCHKFGTPTDFLSASRACRITLLLAMAATLPA